MHTPAYADPRFRQCLPIGRKLVLLGDVQNDGVLLYRDHEDGTEYLVPNVWYNQPIDSRIAYWRYLADCASENAARLRTLERFWDAHAAELRAQQYRRLERDMTMVRDRDKLNLPAGVVVLTRRP